MVSVYTTFTDRLFDDINRLAYERDEPRTRTIRLLLELGLDAYEERPLSLQKRWGAEMFRAYTTFTSNLITVHMLLELGLDAYKERQLAKGRQSEVAAVTAESSSPMSALANSIKRAR
jgi:hypothetical protein